MVLVWSYLVNGDAAYTLVQVATNDLIILIAFTPIVAFLLGISNIPVPWMTLFLSVLLFIVVPLAGGWFTRVYLTKKEGKAYFENTFIPKFGNVTIIGLLLTLVIIFSFQGATFIRNPIHILLMAIPFGIEPVPQTSSLRFQAQGCGAGLTPRFCHWVSAALLEVLNPPPCLVPASCGPAPSRFPATP